MVRIHVMVVLASCCAALGQDLTIELERVNSPSEAVTVTQYRMFMDGSQLKLPSGRSSISWSEYRVMRLKNWQSLTRSDL